MHFLSYPVMPSRPCHYSHTAVPPVPTEDEEGVEEEGEEFEESSGDGLSDEDETELHDSNLPMKVLPLYSLLSPVQQCKVGIADEQV